MRFTLLVIKRSVNKIHYIVLFTLFCTFVSTNVLAADGCLVGGVLYTMHVKSGKFFYRAPGDILADCGVSGTINGKCRLYNSGNINNNSSYTQYSNAYSKNIIVIPCPIDDEIYLLLLAVSLGIVVKFSLN